MSDEKQTAEVQHALSGNDVLASHVIWDRSLPMVGMFILHPFEGEFSMDLVEKHGRAWGAGGVILTYLFSERASSSEKLLEKLRTSRPPRHMERPLLRFLELVIVQARFLVAAWGPEDEPEIQERVKEILRVTNMNVPPLMGMRFKKGSPDFLDFGSPPGRRELIPYWSELGHAPLPENKSWIVEADKVEKMVYSDEGWGHG